MTRPRVLVFSSLLPVPVDRGDRNRLFHILRLLADVATVRLVAIERAWEPPSPDFTPLAPIEVRTLRVSSRQVVMRGAWAAATGRPYVISRYASPRLLEFVRHHAGDFRPDVFWGFQASAFPFLSCAPHARKIVDLVDSPSRYASIVRATREIGWASRLAMRVQWRLAESERQAIMQCDAALANSSTDLAYLRTLLGSDERLVLFENCVPRSFLATSWSVRPGRPPQLLFVGNLAYPPNAAAVRLIATAILPLVRSRVPEARLVVCGARGESLARELGGQPGVRFLGFVDDLVRLYLESSVMLVPIPLAGGSQYKVLESLAIGLPSVVSPSSAEITRVQHGRQVLVGATPEEHADAVCRLLADQNLAGALSRAGRAFVEAEHTWESKAGLVARLLEGRR